MNKTIVAAAALIVTGLLIPNIASAQQPGIKRTDLLRHDLSVPGRFGTDLLISRVFRMSARVSRNNVFNSFQIVKNRFDTPKTSRRQSCRFQVRVFHISIKTN